VTCAVLILAVAGLTVLRVGTGSSRLPERGIERTSLSGLQTNVLIRIDIYGVPHLRAGPLDDLWFAQGYIHARDRFFQMELARRAASGRLSEVFGERMLDLDRTMRVWRLAATARRQLSELETFERAALAAYANGVNAAIEQYGRWLSPELVFLDVRPEPWRIEDSLAVALLLYVRAEPAMVHEIARSRELERLGRQRAVDLWGWSAREARRWLPEGDLAAQPIEPDEPFSTPFGTSIGSAWAVEGRRTRSGYPVVAVDPVDRVTVPVAWYVMDLQNPDVRLAGLTVPGMPAVISGHTGRVAWGMVPTGFDDQDLFRIEVDETGRRERIDGKWWNLRIVVDEVEVRGRVEPVLHEVKVSRIGPVVRERNREVLAMAWSALEGRTPIGAFLRSAFAASANDVIEAWLEVGGSPLNIVAADSDGAVLHRVVGSVPVRGAGGGRVPAPGNDSDWHWIGHRALRDSLSRSAGEHGALLAGTYNPFSEGELRSPREPVLGEYSSPWRRRRVLESIQRSTRWDLASLLELQTDLRDSRATLLLQLLRPALQEHGGSTARALLRWDGRLTASSEVATRYVQLVHELCAAVGDDEALGDGLPRGLFTPDRLTALLGGAISEAWWDDVRTIRTETRESVITAVLDRLDRQRTTPPWGELHRIEISHVLGSVPLLKDAWSRKPFPVGGSDATVLTTPWSDSSSWSVRAWQSARLIMDVGDWNRSIAVLPMGQSGRVWSQHYDDSQGDWLHGRPRPLAFSPASIGELTKARIVLVPSQDGPDSQLDQRPGSE
jgi:penicillin amidase